MSTVVHGVRKEAGSRLGSPLEEWSPGCDKEASFSQHVHKACPVAVSREVLRRSEVCSGCDFILSCWQ